jgi:hypothetical protein
MNGIGGSTSTTEREVTAEDLGEDVVAVTLAVVAAEHGRISMLRRVNGVRVRIIVEVS